jgi:nicotinate-nucleotide pyrophosphorylase (carboxylating)
MPLNKNKIRELARQSLREDAAGDDITTLDFIPSEARVEAKIIAREDGIVCGIDIACEVFRAFNKKVELKKVRCDGQRVFRGAPVLIICGQGRALLSCERVALNFLSYLSGIATQTYRAVRQVRSKGISVLDTRKTTPLYRTLEKYAVLMGQGKNHRLDLSGQYLLKDNHLAILKKTGGLEILTSRRPGIPLEIEVENFGELKKVLSYCPDIIMLDNFSPVEIKKAIRYLRKMFPRKEKRPLLELSGGISLGNISHYAIKGVDFISLGALTHSAPALDLSMEIVKVYSR